MRQLSESDTALFYLETPDQPLHTGNLFLLQNRSGAQALDLSALKAHVATRLHLSRRLRQRIMQLPMRLDNPYWVDDTRFDLDRHFVDISLPTPGKLRNLLAMVSDNLATLLPRDRPLWQIVLFRNLADEEHCPGATAAVFIKAHQVLVNPLTGRELAGLLLDPLPRISDTPAPAWKPAMPPGALTVAGHAYGNMMSVPLRWAMLAQDAAGATVYRLLMSKLQDMALPSALFRAPVAAFNTRVTAERRMAVFTCGFDRIRRLKRSAPNVTTSALLITLCSEALRACLARRARLPEASLSALMPISVRSRRIETPSGSQMASLILSLATDEADLAMRLSRIDHALHEATTFDEAVGAQHLTRLPPSTLVALASRTCTEFLLAQRYKPVFNLPLLNVPGPKDAEYLGGHRVMTQIPLPPLFHGIGLCIVVTTYGSSATITMSACPTAFPNLADLACEFEPALQRMIGALERGDWKATQQRSQTVSRSQQPSILAALLKDSRKVVELVLSQVSGRERRKLPRAAERNEVAISDSEGRASRDLNLENLPADSDSPVPPEIVKPL